MGWVYHIKNPFLDTEPLNFEKILKVHEKTAPALHWLCANESLHRYNDQRLLQFVH
jgi:hypothetical protein